MASKNLLSCSKRGCSLSSNLNGNSEFVGKEDSRSGLSFRIRGFVLSEREEIEAIIGPYDKIFNTRSKPHEPAFENIRGFDLHSKFTNSSVSLFLNGEDGSIVLPCDLSKIYAQPKTGGVCEIEVMVYSHPDRAVVGVIWDNLRRSCSASIRFGKLLERQEQPQLPMSQEGIGASSNADAEEDSEQMGMH